MARETGAGSSVATSLLSAPTRSGLTLARDKVLFGVLPAAVLTALLVSAKHFGFDFKPLWEASHHVFHGASPYPVAHAAALRDEQQFVYPPIAAVMAAPLAIFPFTVAAVLFAALELVATALTLRLLDVRDWRCYGLALLWMPVIENMMIGSISSVLALGLAYAWRHRDTRWRGPITVAALISAKVFLWPVLLWLVATRRSGAAARAFVISFVMVFGSWALIGFAGLASYPRLLNLLAGLEQWKSYSAVAFGIVLGLSAGAARALALTACAAAIGGMLLIWLRRELDDDSDRHIFVLALFAAFLFSPIVWLHYLALLIVPIAITRPVLTPVWFIPLAMWATPDQSHGRPWRVTLGLAVWVVVLAASWRQEWRLPTFRRTADGLTTAVEGSPS